MSDRWTQHNMDKCGVAWWKMDESSGNIIDSKGSNTGTNVKTTVITSPWYRCRNFNGSSYIRCNSQVIPLGAKSIRFKVKTTNNITSEQDVVLLFNSDGYGIGSDGIRITQNTDNKIYIAQTVDSSPIFKLASEKAINDGQWHDVLFTWDGTLNPNGVKLYIDNMMIPDATSSAISTSVKNASFPLHIGTRARATGPHDRNFIGQLDEIEIYNDVIDPIPKYYFIQTNDNKIWTYNTTWQDTGMVIGDLDYTNVSAKSNFETYGMFADENLSSQALQDLKDMGYTSYRVLMGKM